MKNQAMLKRTPDDFWVDEVASYEPTGKGTHLWMRLGKRGLSTRAAIGRVATALDVEARQIGYAGQKDARAVTSQWISVEHPPADHEARLGDLLGDADCVSAERPLVLSSLTFHKNRLGLGHLHGNRFRVRMRGLNRVPSLERVMQCGAANRFGHQRFGHRGDSGRIGEALVQERFDDALALVLGTCSDVDTGRIAEARSCFDNGDLKAARDAWPRDFALERRLLGSLLSGGDGERAFGKADRRDLDFFKAALQSELFNRLVDLREELGLLGELLEGDLAMRLPIARKAFVIEDLAVERERAARLEIAPSGPLFGEKMPWPTGRALELEREVLGDLDLSSGLSGGRRALLMRVDDGHVEAGEDSGGQFFELRFGLSKGCYATSLIDAVQGEAE